LDRLGQLECWPGKKECLAENGEKNIYLIYEFCDADLEFGDDMADDVS
jgi:hypothetical protein